MNELADFTKALAEIESQIETLETSGGEFAKLRKINLLPGPPRKPAWLTSTLPPVSVAPSASLRLRPE
jgi:hypothetical protein